MKFWKNIISNKIYQTILCILSLVVPIVTYLFVTNSSAPNVLNFLCIGFYSSLFLCLSKVNKWIKIIAVLINLIPFIFIMFFFMMGGVGIIPGMILKAILPFVPNPWL